MSSSQAVAASLMRPLPPDAAPERSVFDLDEHQQPEPPAQSSQLGEVVTSLDSITPVESHLQDTASLPAAPDGYKGQSENEKQNAASALLAQLLASKPLTADSPQQSAAASPKEPSPLHNSNNGESTTAGPDAVPQITDANVEKVSENVNQVSNTTENIGGGGEGDAQYQATTEDVPMDITDVKDSLGELQFMPEDSTNMPTQASDLNQIFSDFASLGTPAPATTDALEQNGLLVSSYLGGTLNGGGPTPRIVGYPELPANLDGGRGQDGAESSAGSEPRIQAFAKLEFDDGHFYVNTYSFILGRDVRAARAAFQRDVVTKQNKPQNSIKSRPSSRMKREGSGIYGSVISDMGGIMGFDPDVPQNFPPQMSWKSSNSSADHVSRPILHISHSETQDPNSLEQNDSSRDYNALAMQSLQRHYEPKRVDTVSLLPSPESCPLIPVHPPTTVNGVSSHRSISRKHAKICYNFNKNVFEMEVIGRNGAFMGADWLAPGQVRPLHSGDFIQIGGVRIRFLLPDVPIGDTGAEMVEPPLPEVEKKEPLAIKDQAKQSVEVDPANALEPAGDFAESSDEAPLAGNKASSAGASEPKLSSEPNRGGSQPRRRGPGRPPKDGIMSKRERAEIAREQKLAAKREANGGVTPPPASKIKPLKPTKEPSVEDSVVVKTEKRKYTKRKKPDSVMGDTIMTSIEGGMNGRPEVPLSEPPVRVAPVKKRKPSRSPSPDYPPESFYTPKELAKPPYNYAVLIFDALSESPTPMTLKQIYRALKLKYPYFRFKCETEGWTSSVRHNLNGNAHLFTHAERDGKGWSWKLMAGASVDKEKKRRPSPPPQDMSSINNSQRFMPPSTQPYAGHPTHISPPHYPYPPPPNPQYRPPPPAQAPPAPAPVPPPPPTNNPTYTKPAPQNPIPQPVRSSLPTTFGLTPNYLTPYPSSINPHASSQQRQYHQPPIQPHPTPPAHHQSQTPQFQSQPRPLQYTQHPHQPQQSQQPQRPQQAQSQQPQAPPRQPPPPPPTTQPSQPSQPFQPPAPPQPQPHQPPPQSQPQPQHQHQHQHQFQFQHHPPPNPPNQFKFHNQIMPPNHNNMPKPPANNNQPPAAAPPQPVPQQKPPSAPPPAPAAAPAPSSSTAISTQGMDPEFLSSANQAIDNFEAVLIEDYEDQDYIRGVLRSARDRVLNGAKESSFPGGEPKDESVIMDALKGIIGSLTEGQAEMV